MKVILREDMAGRGIAGETVEVKDGYARNYLLPRNIAIAATRGNVLAIDEVRTQKSLRDRKRRREAEKIKDKIESLSLTADALVGEDDRLFGSVTTQDIADLMAAKGVTVDRRKIMLDENIKALGIYTIPVKIDVDVVANVKLFVVKKSSV